jgi:hypothetical protein
MPCLYLTAARLPGSGASENHTRTARSRQAAAAKAGVIELPDTLLLNAVATGPRATSDRGRAGRRVG